MCVCVCVCVCACVYVCVCVCACVCVSGGGTGGSHVSASLADLQTRNLHLVSAKVDYSSMLHAVSASQDMVETT